MYINSQFKDDEDQLAFLEDGETLDSKLPDPGKPP